MLTVVGIDGQTYFNILRRAEDKVENNREDKGKEPKRSQTKSIVKVVEEVTGSDAPVVFLDAPSGDSKSLAIVELCIALIKTGFENLTVGSTMYTLGTRDALDRIKRGADELTEALKDWQRRDKEYLAKVIALSYSQDT